MYASYISPAAQTTLGPVILSHGYYIFGPKRVGKLETPPRSWTIQLRRTGFVVVWCLGDGCSRVFGGVFGGVCFFVLNSASATITTVYLIQSCFSCSGVL